MLRFACEIRGRYIYMFILSTDRCEFICEGKIGMGEKLNWATRVQVVLDAAQGMLKKIAKKYIFILIFCACYISFLHVNIYTLRPFDIIYIYIYRP